MTEKQKWAAVLTHVVKAINHLRDAMKILGSGPTHAEINEAISGPLVRIHALVLSSWKHASDAEVA